MNRVAYILAVKNENLARSLFKASYIMSAWHVIAYFGNSVNVHKYYAHIMQYIDARWPLPSPSSFANVPLVNSCAKYTTKLPNDLV